MTGDTGWNSVLITAMPGYNDETEKFWNMAYSYPPPVQP